MAEPDPGAVGEAEVAKAGEHAGYEIFNRVFRKVSEKFEEKRRG